MIAEIQVALAEQNRWKDSPENEIYPKGPRRERHMVRHLISCLLANSPNRYHLLLGPRQTGKTVAMKQVMFAVSQQVSPDQIFYIEADHPHISQHSLEDTVKIVEEMSNPTQQNPVFLFIDEIAKAADWQDWLKSWHASKRPYRILASSSNALDLHRGESGPGRREEHFLFPLNFLEYTEFQSEPNSADLIPKWCRTQYPTLTERLREIPPVPFADETSNRRLLALMLLGGYPEVRSTTLPSDSESIREQTKSAHKLLSSIANTVVLKDIAEQADIRNLAGLGQTFEAVGNMIGKEGTSGTIAKGVTETAVKTVEDYLECLERVNLVFRLSQLSERAAGSGKFNKKFYFWDTALASAISKRGDLIIRDGKELGHAKENLAAACLMELATRERKRLNYWRKNSRYEVDFIYDGIGKGECLAVEVGGNKDNKANLSKLIQAKPKFDGNSYLVTDRPAVVKASHSGIGELPFDLFLMAVCAQSIQSALEHATSKLPANHKVLTRTNKLFPMSAAMSGSAGMSRSAVASTPATTSGSATMPDIAAYNQPTFEEGDIVMLTNSESQEATAHRLVEKC